MSVIIFTSFPPFLLLLFSPPSSSFFFLFFFYFFFSFPLLLLFLYFFYHSFLSLQLLLFYPPPPPSSFKKNRDQFIQSPKRGNIISTLDYFLFHYTPRSTLLMILMSFIYQVHALQPGTVVIASYTLLQNSVITMTLPVYNNQMHNYHPTSGQHILGFYITSCRNLLCSSHLCTNKVFFHFTVKEISSEMDSGLPLVTLSGRGVKHSVIWLQGHCSFQKTSHSIITRISLDSTVCLCDLNFSTS